MKKTFALGAAVGATSLLVAVPLFAQLSNAAQETTTNGTRMTSSIHSAHPAPTQQQVKDMAAKDDAFLKNIDAFTTIVKSATQTHSAALKAAATMTDDTQRAAAVKKANEDMRATIKAAVDANPDLKSAMMPFGGRGFEGRHGRGFGHGPGNLAEKLGMTPDELKTALDGGKTIEDIAKEKGITLPPRPAFKGGMMDNEDVPPARQ